MKRIYVAGAYSADNVIDILDNMRRGMKLAKDVLLAGYAPFCPWMDFHYSLMLDEGERLVVEDYYEYSIAWLEVSDGMILVPGWENSKGTVAEIDKANAFAIPVFSSIKQLNRFFV